eukprot:gb/GECH01008934.1/.p1 GENE.gb/GECH01008934.1/~~gb/GECH01008934.1/.p1  ORF type:complete len:215 (+),score=24.37 gb/GECH01008934.1/:1-645(+)
MIPCMLWSTLTKDSKNFSRRSGALNNQGGEFKVNVAITRAIGQNHIFYPKGMMDKLQPNDPPNNGIDHILRFIEYAKNPSILKSSSTSTSNSGFFLSSNENKDEDWFVKFILDYLRECEFQFELNVGQGHIRVPVAVKHPSKNEYKAAIFFDDDYHKWSTLRDCFLVRDQALESMGWNVIRINRVEWYMKWFHQYMGDASEKGLEWLRKQLEAY